MAMAMVVPCPSSSELESWASSSTQQGRDVSLPCNELWNMVDLAERYLIGSQHDEAAATALAVLRNLKDSYGLFEHYEDISCISHGVMDEHEVADIIESAGMVVIQAYNESGRSKTIFKDLETIFGCLAMMPSSVFLAGLCWQVSARLYLDAEMSVESFLKHWTFPSNGDELCKLKLSSAPNFVSLNCQQYMKIADIYAVQVLAQGLGRVDQALHWVKEAEFPIEMKQDMLKRLEALSSRVDKQVDKDRNFQNRVGRGASACSFSVNSATQTRPTMQTAYEANSRSLRKTFPLCFYVTEVISGWRSPSLVNRASTWDQALPCVLRGKPILSGAAITFVIVALYRQRLNVSRVIGGLIRLLKTFSQAIYVAVVDFWQLAFNVQLNPLAAVQPLQQLLI